MANESLRLAIERLLIPYVRGLLADRIPREPVLGALTVAKPIYREPLESSLLELYIESGFLAWGATPTFPLTVYSTSALKTYLDGTGTEVSEGVSQWLIGKAQSHSCGTGGAIYYDFPATKPSPIPEGTPLYPPLHEPDGSYASQIYQSAEPSVPVGVWTGEGRRLYQALLAAGRTWADVLPSGWVADPESMGAWRDPLGGWWVYRCTSSGLVCGQLALPSALTCDGTIPAGVSTPLEKALLEAFRLGRAVRPSAVLTLLDSDDMYPCYSSGAAPLYHGWHGLYQPAVDDPAGCVMVATRYVSGTTTWYSRSCAIGISWADGVPSATLVVSADLSWGGGRARIRVPISETQSRVQPSGTGVLGHDTTVYAFTTPDGVCDLVCVAKQGSYNTDYGTAVEPTITGNGSQHAISNGGTQTNGGVSGWRVDGAGASAVIDPIYAQTKTSFEVTITAGTIVSFSSADLQGSDVMTYQQSRPYAPDVWASRTDSPAKIFTLQEASWEFIHTETIGLVGLGWGMASLLYDDTGVVIGTRQEWSSGIKGSRTKTGSSGIGCDGYSSTGEHATFMHAPYGVANICWVTGPSYLVPGGAKYLSGGYDVSGGIPGSSLPSAEVSIQLVPSSGDVITLGSDWNGIADTATDTNIPYVLASWGGEIVYADSTSSLAGPSGIPSGVLSAANRRFIGAI